jgi:nitroreductase/dihydropteridine reductase
VFKHAYLSYLTIEIMSLINALEWRYATKKFDSTKKVTAEDLDTLLKSVQLAPSSYGLQPFKILVIEDAGIRAQLREAAYGQAQLTDSSHVIVFAAETEINEALVARYIDNIASTRQIDRAMVADFENTINGAIERLGEDSKIGWAHKQAYLALGVLLTAAAELKIDACPMEGLSPSKFGEILGLKEKGLTTSVIAPIGYRAEDDQYANLAKVRRSESELFIKI